MSECKLKGFQQVLVRDEEGQEWVRQFFSYYDETSEYPYGCMGDRFKLCIPYEGNEHLAGTSNAYGEPYEPKDGDFVYVKLKTGSEYVFIKRKGDDLTAKYISLNVKSAEVSDHCPRCCYDDDILSIRPATNAEKNLLLSKLHELGKDWDEEKKEIVDCRWQPSDGETYYCPSYSVFDFVFSPYSTTWDHGEIDLARKERNFVFRTEEECQTMCNRLNAAIEKVK